MRTKLKVCNNEIENLKNLLNSKQEAIHKLEKDFKSLESTKDYYYKKHEVLEKEIDQLHEFLDAVPNSIPRKQDRESCYSIERNVMTRLIAWLSIR